MTDYGIWNGNLSLSLKGYGRDGKTYDRKFKHLQYIMERIFNSKYEEVRYMKQPLILKFYGLW